MLQLRHGLVGAILVLLAGSCSFVQTEFEELHEGLSGGGEASRDLRAATRRLGAAINLYWLSGEGQSSSPPQSLSEWEDFYRSTERNLQAVESAFNEWAPLIDNHTGPHSDELSDFRNSLESWVAAQRQQARLSRACFEAGPTFPSPEARSCFLRMFQEHGTEWQEIGARVQSDYQRLEDVGLVDD